MNNFFDRIKVYVGALLISLLGEYRPALLAEVESPALAGGVDRLFLRTEEVIKAITDENPDNKEQLEAILRRFVGEDVISALDGLTEEQLLKLQNLRVRRGLTLLSVPVLDALRLLTDEDPDNAAQAETVLDTFLTNPDAQNFIISDLTLPALEKLIPNALIRGFVFQGIEIGIREGLHELADKDTFDRAELLEEVKAAHSRAEAEVDAGKEVTQ